MVYDLEQPEDRARVYEQVLREGTEDDVRLYVDADELLDMWDRLALPPRVRHAWAALFEHHRDVARWKERGLELAIVNERARDRDADRDMGR
ncbi:MAG: hypothetical protein ACRD0L_10965 [Acidimicrobiales bacterium]